MVFGSNEIEMKQFEAVFEDIVNSMTNDFIEPLNEVKSVLERLKKMLDYNVPGGKKMRGPFLVKAYKAFCNDKFDEDDIYLACVLGWCIEMFQAIGLIVDDIVDHSQTRRGQPCWYKKEGVGMTAIKDAFGVENCTFLLLKKFFQHKQYYIYIIELFHDVLYLTATGQSLDLMTSSTAGQIEFDKFTLDRYNTIVQYKTSYYSFFLPIALALYMAEISDPKVHDKAKKVLLEIGNLFQVQDDYIDCFGNPVITGKIGTDIEEGKCTWLVVTALKLASPAQVGVIQENYGKNKPECVGNVKSIYEQLEIPNVFNKYEEDQYERIIALIDKLEPDIPSNIFLQLINFIHKRQL